jgi:hypothetical protein
MYSMFDACMMCIAAAKKAAIVGDVPRGGGAGASMKVGGFWDDSQSFEVA